MSQTKGLKVKSPVTKPAVGDIVLFDIGTGQKRPAMVVKVDDSFETGTGINLQVFMNADGRRGEGDNCSPVVFYKGVVEPRWEWPPAKYGPNDPTPVPPKPVPSEPGAPIIDSSLLQARANAFTVSTWLRKLITKIKSGEIDLKTSDDDILGNTNTAYLNAQEVEKFLATLAF